MTATEPTRCPSDEQLSAFIAGRLTAAETDQLAQHLDACADCQQRLAALDDSSVSVDSWAAAGGAVPFAEESQCGRLVEDLAARRHDAAGVGSPVAAAPKQLGEYELLERLGEGGMGAVYKARHRGLETLVAVKVLHPQRQADEITLERFQREMIAIGRLDHPQIVRAIDAGEDQGIHYLVMEFVDGVDLARVVQQGGSLPLADACEVIRQAALGLAYVHRQGRVHRDVKPSNLMLANDGTVKILDLGLAQVAEYTIEEGGGGADDLLGGSSKADLTRTHQVMGTLEYMAPEQARDSRRVDYRADIYSLGATFYKLLTGHSPFATSGNITAMSQVLAHVQAPAPPVRNYRPDVPADVAILLERMLSKSPHERPDSADEIAAALAPHCRTAALRPLLETTTIRSERSTDDRLAATVVELPPVRVADHGRRPFPWLAAAVVLGLLAVVMGCMVGLAVWTMRPSSGFVVVKAESDETTEALQSQPVFLVRRDNNLRMLLQTGRRRLPAGDYVIETEAGSALVFSPNRFTVRRNQQLVLQASLASLNEMAMSVEPEMAEIGPALAASGPPVDLIPLLDPVRDIRGDDWRIVDGALVSDASKNSMLHFPYRPPASYRLEMTAERLQFDESLNIGLVAGDNPLIITVDGYPKAGSYSGVYRVDGIGPTHQPSRNTHRGLVLPLNRPVQLVATVIGCGPPT
ncbi:MAG: protein kinase, partial [Planctomycetales bacterium]|nr:protein kinase [Planctomycetales bacterium]